MKRLILSRKGFDSASGGCPNPVFADGSVLALPIPDAESSITYGEISHQGQSLGGLVEDLTGGRVRRSDGAHLDPDLIPGAYPRNRDWRPLFGQHGSAQGHLARQGVGAGDLFLFFALFRQVERSDGRWRFVPGSRPYHGLWGWLQVAEVVPLVETRHVPFWMAYHPHCHGQRGAQNTLYVARDRLTLPGQSVAAEGGGVFPRPAKAHRLSCPEGRGVTDWLLPDAFYPCPGRTPLSYHHNPDRWQLLPGGLCSLRSAARGQEFVLSLKDYPDVLPRLAALFSPRTT